MTGFPTKTIQIKRLACFTHILNAVAGVHIGKTKRQQKAKLWMTPQIRAKMCKLHRTVNANCQEWTEAGIEANEAINEAKTSSWKRVLEDAAMTNINRKDLWRFIGGLNGIPEAIIKRNNGT